MTTIFITGSPTPQRLAKILDAAVGRLGMTELAVMADSEADGMVCEWNTRRYRLTRYYPPTLPVWDIAMVFGGDDPVGEGRVIRC